MIITQALKDLGYAAPSSYATIKFKGDLVYKYQDMSWVHSDNTGMEITKLTHEFNVTREAHQAGFSPDVFSHEVLSEDTELLVMERVYGCTLSQFMSMSMFRTPERHELVLSQLIELKERLQEFPWEHGDLHSNNIMVAVNGRVKLIDWGNSFIKRIYGDYELDVCDLEHHICNLRG